MNEPVEDPGDIRTAAADDQPVTYSSDQVCAITGATYRQLDHWCRRTGSSLASTTPGSGHARRFTHTDLTVVHFAVRLRRAGFTLEAALRIAGELAAHDRHEERVCDIFDLTISPTPLDQLGPEQQPQVLAEARA